MTRNLDLHHRRKLSAAGLRLSARYGCGALAIGLTALPLLAGTARADVVTGVFTATIGDISDPGGFADAAGYAYTTGDGVTGIFTFDTVNYIGTFTATLTDTTTNETFVMPLGKAVSGSASVPSMTEYDVAATDSLVSDPGQEDQTAYTTSLALALIGSGLVPGDLTQTVSLGGTGSFGVNIPAEGPYPAESATFALDDVAAAIPEPASMTALGIGLAGLLAARRRARG